MIFLAHEGSHGGLFNPWELHPALNHLPIAFLLAGIALDLYAWWRGRADLVQVATGLLIAGVLTGVLTALAGVLAFLTVPGHTQQAHQLMYWHMAIQATALFIFACSAFERWWNGSATPSLAGRLVGCIAGVLLLIGSGIGGYIVYHGGAGVSPELLAPAIRDHHHGPETNQYPTAHYDDPGHDEHDTGKKKEVPRQEPVDQHADAHKQHDQTSKDAPKDGHLKAEEASPVRKHKEDGKYVLPEVPSPSASAAYVAQGYYVQIVLNNLTYPSSLEFDDQGNLYVAEAGLAPGGQKAAPRIIRLRLAGQIDTVVSEGLLAPVTDLRWYQGKLYISHGVKISAWSEEGKLVDLVTGLPGAGGQYHKPVMTVAQDGHLYLCRGDRLLRVDSKTREVTTIFGRDESHDAHKGQGKAQPHDQGKTHQHKNHQSVMKQGATPKTRVKDAHQDSTWSADASAGPRRLMEVRFSPRDDALYVVDFGAVFVTPDGPRSVPGTGVVWRIIGDDAPTPMLMP